MLLRVLLLHNKIIKILRYKALKFTVKYTGRINQF